MRHCCAVSVATAVVQVVSLPLVGGEGGSQTVAAVAVACSGKQLSRRRGQFVVLSGRDLTLTDGVGSRRNKALTRYPFGSLVIL